MTMPNVDHIKQVLSDELKTDKTIKKLEAVLDFLCKMTDRDITIFYPTKQSEIVPYLKKEIKTTLELVK